MSARLTVAENRIGWVEKRPHIYLQQLSKKTLMDQQDIDDFDKWQFWRL